MSDRTTTTTGIDGVVPFRTLRQRPLADQLDYWAAKLTALAGRTTDQDAFVIAVGAALPMGAIAAAMRTQDAELAALRAQQTDTAELEWLREIEAAYQEITDPAVRHHRGDVTQPVTITAFVEQVAAKLDARAKLAEACREVERLRGRQAEPTGVMTVPSAERFEAIRARYHEFAFSGPDDVDRERDQVIGFLLDESDRRGDECDELRAQADLDLRAVIAFLDATERADLNPPEPFDPNDHRGRAHYHLHNHFMPRIQDAIFAGLVTVEREPLAADEEASDG